MKRVLAIAALLLLAGCSASAPPQPCPPAPSATAAPDDFQLNRAQQGERDCIIATNLADQLLLNPGDGPLRQKYLQQRYLCRGD